MRFGTFAGVFSPEFVVVLAFFWNICGKNSGVCCCFGGFVEHLPEFFLIQNDIPFTLLYRKCRFSAVFR